MNNVIPYDNKINFSIFFLSHIISVVCKMYNIGEIELIKIIYNTRFYTNLIENDVISCYGTRKAIEILIDELIDKGYEIDSFNDWLHKNKFI